MANIKIQLKGGFHNAPLITVSLPSVIVQGLKSGDLALTDWHVLSRAQRLKLDRHFCGVKGCKCGGVARAEIIF